MGRKEEIDEILEEKEKQGKLDSKDVDGMIDIMKELDEKIKTMLSTINKAHPEIPAELKEMVDQSIKTGRIIRKNVKSMNFRALK